MGADSSFYVKSIATYAPAFLGYNISVLARVLLNEWIAEGVAFDPYDFSVKLYLSTKLRGKRAKMESRRRSHGHSRVEIRISCISVSCQTLVIHCIQFRVLLLNL